MRTLLRPGRRGVLVKVEDRGRACFLVGGPAPKDRQTFFDLDAAVHSFEDLEEGRTAPREAPSRALAVLRRLPTPFGLVLRLH